MRRYRFCLLILLLTAGGLQAGSAAVAGNRFVGIGTGGVTGVYYPAGAAICRLLNQGRAEHGIRCAAESTSGSVYNLSAIATGDFDIGIIQSDWQYHAYRGTSQFDSQGPNKQLRALFSLHPEAFTVVARSDSGIHKFADLKGKRVNIGNPGSGQRATMDVVMVALGWENQDFAAVTELESAEQSQALCENKFDAMVFTVGHPSGSIKEATSACETELVEVAGPAIDQLVADNDYYLPATIPVGIYRGVNHGVKTFGGRATVVSSAELADEVAYQIVKVVFENFTEFRKQHPAFISLKKERMVADGLSAPLHRGAIKYFKEAGLL